MAYKSGEETSYCGGCSHYRGKSTLGHHTCRSFKRIPKSYITGTLGEPDQCPVGPVPRRGSKLTDGKPQPTQPQAAPSGLPEGTEPPAPVTDPEVAKAAEDHAQAKAGRGKKK